MKNEFNMIVQTLNFIFSTMIFQLRGCGINPSKYITNLQINITLRFQKENSKLFTFRSLLIEPCTNINSEDSQISDALENVAKIYGTQKITKVVHGHLQEDEDL